MNPPVGGSVQNIASVAMRGDVAYSAQEAWLSKGSIREAILFGREYDEKRYLDAIYDAGLDDDIASGTLSHHTEVGEGGSALSGGQRARVQLARAMYGDKTGVYLLDDPLSALDAAVGATVFERVSKRIRERNAAAILVTNDVSLPRQCDRVVLMGKMNSGSKTQQCSCILDTGTYDEIISHGHDLSSITIHQEIEDDSSTAGVEQSTTAQNENAELDEIDKDYELMNGEAEDEEDNRDKLDTQHAASDVTKEDEKIQVPIPEKRDDNNSSTKSMDDKMTEGAVPRSTYKTYFKSVGKPMLIAGALSCYLMANGAQFYQQYVVAKWTELGHDTALSVALGGKYLRSLIYAAGVVSVFLWLRSYLLMRVGTRASQFLHKKMLTSVFNAPVTFFDSTPSGQLLSRFGKELEVVDRGVPDGIGSVLFCLLNVFMTVAGLTGMLTPKMAVPLIFVSVFYNSIMGRFRPAARDLKRVESKSRSPIYTHFGEALKGAETIRSFPNSSALWTSNLRTLVDNNLAVFHSVKGLDRWLSIRLESLGNIVVLMAAAASVFLTRSGKLQSGSAGWGLTQSLAITGLLTWTVRVLTDLETQMMSVMRVTEVTGLDQDTNSIDGQLPAIIPQEKSSPGEALIELYDAKTVLLPPTPTNDDALISTGWPWKGGISFNNVSMRYSPTSSRVLKNVNLTIPHGTTLVSFSLICRSVGNHFRLSI